MDAATIALLGIYHGQSNPDRISISDIDKLIDLEKSFDKRHGNTDWEESDTDWADAVAKWYNDKRDKNWNKIGMVDDDPIYKAKKVIGQYLSNDPEEYEIIVNTLKKYLKKKPKEMINYIQISTGNYISQWDGLKYDYNVKDFCKLIGLTQ